MCQLLVAKVITVVVVLPTILLTEIMNREVNMKYEFDFKVLIFFFFPLLP